jgi:DNA-binding NarL/FixJ family response regulator
MKILIVDDHPLALIAWSAMVRDHCGDAAEIVTLTSAAGLRKRLAEDHAFDLMLLDSQLWDGNGLMLLKECHRRFPNMRIVLVSESEQFSDVINAIDLGAVGFLPKRSSIPTLRQALGLLIEGGVYVPPIDLGTPLPAAAPWGSPGLRSSAS